MYARSVPAVLKLQASKLAQVTDLREAIAIQWQLKKNCRLRE